MGIVFYGMSRRIFELLCLFILFIPFYPGLGSLTPGAWVQDLDDALSVELGMVDPCSRTGPKPLKPPNLKLA